MSNTTPTPLDLAPIRARAEAATHHDWVVPVGEWVRCRLCGALQDGTTTACQGNRADVPALIAEVERLRAENARLREGETAAVNRVLDECGATRRILVTDEDGAGEQRARSARDVLRVLAFKETP